MNYILLIKILFSTIKAVEELMADSPGKDKLEAAIALTEGIVGDLGTLAPAIEKLITMIVGGFNATGIFKKKVA